MRLDELGDSIETVEFLQPLAQGEFHIVGLFCLVRVFAVLSIQSVDVEVRLSLMPL